MNDLVLLLFIISAGINARYNLDNVSSATIEVESLLKEAKNCLPKVHDNEIILCTGQKVKRKTFTKMQRSGENFCIGEIEKLGYKYLKEGQVKIEASKRWLDFYQSTKKALVYHDNKTVFAKKKTGLIDCVHEYIHVIQWSTPSESLLSPESRKEVYQKLENALIDVSNQIENLEKKGNKELAKSISEKLSIPLKNLKALSTIETWLDEKDVYYSFLRLCEKELICSKDDLDTIIGNLYNLKEYLPWRLQDQVTALAAKSVREKELSAINSLSYKPLTSKEKNLAKDLLSKDWKSLIKFIKAKGIVLYQFKMSQKTRPMGNEGIIPPSILTSLPEPNKPQLRTLLSYSKVNQGYVLGKYLCQKGKDESYIVVTSNTTKGTLVHEYLHSLQRKKNPNFCYAITGQYETSLLFKTGKLARDEYESKVLSAKALIYRTESEIYKLLSQSISLPQKEINNNKIQYLKYQTFLTSEKNQKELSPPMKFQFKTKDDLPTFTIEDKNIVLDLGAMDSVIDPSLVFKKVKLDDIAPIKTKVLQNAFGNKVDAPYVRVNQKISIENFHLSSSDWILASLGLPNIAGVIGLSFFNGKDFSISPRSGKVEIKRLSKKPPHALKIQKGYANKIKAIEFICKDNLIIRIDSGSQVRGDLNTSLNMKLKSKILGKGISCGNLSIKGPFESILQNDGIFARDVSLNLGWPYLKNLKRIDISLTNGWIAFYP